METIHGQMISQKAFTLVELIVVITILSILGTIGFISIQGYSLSTRNTSRIENLTNLHKGLTLFQVDTGKYPIPESYVLISASGTTINYQGFAKDQVANLAKLSPKSTKDPSDESIFTTYSTNGNQTKMQLMQFLENDSNVTTMGELITPDVHANIGSNYSKRIPITQGDSLGILLGYTGASLNQPVQELLSMSFTGIDIASTSTEYAAIFNKEFSISGSGDILLSALSIGRLDLKEVAKYDSNLVGYWDMETTTLSGGQTVLKDLSGYTNNMILHGVSIGGTPSKFGITTSLAGSTQTISAPNSPSMNFSGSLSISGWINPVNESTGNAQYKVLVLFSGSTTLRDKYASAGYTVVTDIGATTLEAVRAHNPDIIVCDMHAWSCSIPFLGTLYDAGYNIASIGNDSNTGPLPIIATTPTSAVPGIITPDEKHPITWGWTSTADVGSDFRHGITNLSSRSFSIARDQTNNWSEVIYMEESGKGRWIHYQAGGSPNTTLFDNANTFLLRNSLIGKGKNYHLYVQKNILYGFLNNQKLSTSIAAGIWQHVVFVYDMSTIKLYVDGALRAQSTYTGPIDTDGANVILGKTRLSLDELRVYNRALSETEIKTIYGAVK